MFVIGIAFLMDLIHKLQIHKILEYFTLEEKVNLTIGEKNMFSSITEKQTEEELQRFAKQIIEEKLQKILDKEEDINSKIANENLPKKEIQLFYLFYKIIIMMENIMRFHGKQFQS